MDKTSKSYAAGRQAWADGLLYSDEPALLNFTMNIEEWKAGWLDALAAQVRGIRGLPVLGTGGAS